MGFWQKIRGNNNNNQLDNRSGAEKYVDWEGISCDSSMDQNTLNYIYSAFNEDNMNLDQSKWQGNINQIYENLYNHDVNLYKLTQSLLYQNFMLMRKIEALSSELDSIKDICNAIGKKVYNPDNTL